MVGVVIAATSQNEIEAKIDAFLADPPALWKPLQLILPVTGGAYSYSYKNFQVRVWIDNQAGITRYDTAVERDD